MGQKSKLLTREEVWVRRIIIKSLEGLMDPQTTPPPAPTRENKPLPRVNQSNQKIQPPYSSAGGMFLY